MRSPQPASTSSAAVAGRHHRPELSLTAMQLRDVELGCLMDFEALGHAMHQFVATAYPICRSITGDGLRETLRLIQQRIPITIHEVPTGTAVLDWTVPKEWNIRDAYIADASGRRLIDFQASNLHVVGYSVPVHATLSLAELRPHLFTLPEHPEWIPFRTSYYTESWGFCLSQHRLDSLPDGPYEVCIDSSLEDGALSYGELRLSGEQEDEILISCHCCHPSLCNDNLSAVAVACFLAESLMPLSRRYSYRFLFVPGTIGAITWLARNAAVVGRIKHGLVLTCLGDPGPVTYKRSRRGDAEVDQAAVHVLQHTDHQNTVLDFFPYGADERQYCSPGFNLPVGCLMRTQYGRFPEYHTSGDDLTLVQPTALAQSLRLCTSILSVLEDNRRFVNLCPKGEPQLGRRGLWRAGNAPADPGELQRAQMWCLNLSDGRHSILDIATRAGLPFRLVRLAAEHLLQGGLLAEHHPQSAVAATVTELIP